MPKPTYERAAEALAYDPETGVITWRINPGGPKARAGDEAGYVNGRYKKVGLDGEQYIFHRMAWLLMTGSWPDGGMDHVNRIKTDNRWCNLRLADKSQSGANRRAWRRSGLPKGVRRSKAGRFESKITVQSMTFHLGTFDTPEQAHEAYLAAAKRAFGNFACSG